VKICTVTGTVLLIVDEKKYLGYDWWIGISKRSNVRRCLKMFRR